MPAGLPLRWLQFYQDDSINRRSSLQPYIFYPDIEGHFYQSKESVQAWRIPRMSIFEGSTAWWVKGCIPAPCKGLSGKGNHSFLLKRLRTRVSLWRETNSMPDAEKASLPGTPSFLPKYGCRENPGVFLKESGLLQKESLSGALHRLCRGSSREKAKSRWRFRSPQTLAEAGLPILSGSILPSGMSL